MPIVMNASATDQGLTTPAISGLNPSQLAVTACGWATVSSLTTPASDSVLFGIMSSGGSHSLQFGIRDSGSFVAGLYLSRFRTSGVLYRINSANNDLLGSGNLPIDTPFFWCVQHNGLINDPGAAAAVNGELWVRRPTDPNAVQLVNAAATNQDNADTLNDSAGGQLWWYGNRTLLNRAHRGSIWDTAVWTAPAGQFCLSAQNIADLALGQSPRSITPVAGATRRRFLPLASTTQLLCTEQRDNASLVAAVTGASQTHVPRGPAGLALATADGVSKVGSNVVYFDSTRILQSSSVGQNDALLLLPAGDAGALWEPRSTDVRAAGNLCAVAGRQSLAAVPEGNFGGSGQGPRMRYDARTSTTFSNASFHAALVISLKNANGFEDVVLFQVGGGTPTLIGLDGRGRLFVTINGTRTLAVANGQNMRVSARPMPVLVSVTDPGGSSAKAVVIRTPFGRHSYSSGVFTATSGGLAIGETADHNGNSVVYWNLYRLQVQNAPVTAGAQEDAAYLWARGKAGMTADYQGGALIGFTSTAAGTGPSARLGVRSNMSVPCLAQAPPNWWVGAIGIGSWVGASSGNSVNQEITLSAVPSPAIAAGDTIVQGATTGTVHSVTADGLTLNMILVTGTYTAAAATRNPGGTAVTISAVSTNSSQQWLGNTPQTWAIDALNALPPNVPAVMVPLYTSERAVFGQSQAGVLAAHATFRAAVLAGVTGRPVYVVPQEAHPRQPFVSSPASGGALNFAFNEALRALGPTVRLPLNLDYLGGSGYDGGFDTLNDPNGSENYQEALGSRVHLSVEGGLALAPAFLAAIQDAMPKVSLSRLDRTGRSRRGR